LPRCQRLLAAINERNETIAGAILSKMDVLKVLWALILTGNYHASRTDRITRFTDWHPMGWWLTQRSFAARSFDVIY